MNIVGNSGGIDVGQLFQNATNGLSKDGEALQTMMNDISASGEVDQMDLLNLQFAMGQYNAKLETISSVTKSIQDMLKSLAQRTG
ncbi:EscF/YscF/HrpA family type III secretion system needle major subunit [uncultured Desulfovibrio sp.]|uniref:EscF/YscF/HrpA family type III secretion system needle major subunit n=1 Tax=uncultured Desulfovibrio sp. TaxID=167968 RepID=UPI002627EBF0|nr:EscF/YscF/HrpA family type III secretion system needle major subunit [uncultured Desulfovibrio sp.]